MTQDEAFKAWWYTEGSQPPFKHHDCEEHTMRMCEIAWANGAFKEREACAKLCETLWDTPANGMATEDSAYGNECATAIRARGQR